MSNCRVISPERSPGGTISEPFQQCGWAGLKNGEFLRAAAAEGFEILVTADRNLQFQQNLSRTMLGIVLLVAPSNALEDLLPLVPGLRADNGVDNRQSRICRLLGNAVVYQLIVLLELGGSMTRANLPKPRAVRCRLSAAI